MNSATLLQPENELSNNEFDAMLARFVVRHPDQVRSFLSAHSQIAPLLPVVLANARRFFGAGTEVALHVLNLGDGGSGGVLLYALIKTDKPVSEALECMDRLDDDAWCNPSLRSAHELVVSLESA